MSAFGNLKAWITLVWVVILLVRQIAMSTYVLTANMTFSGDESSGPPSIRKYEEITFTDVGWFHPDPSIANNTKRTIGAREFVEAVQAHERFRLSAWTDTNNSTSKPTLVFLDYDACGLYHYPKFGGGDGKVNADTLDGRPAGRPNISEVCTVVDEALARHSNALSHVDSRLVVLSCNEHRTDGIVAEHCLNNNRNMALYHKLVVGHMSAASRYVHRKHDFGLPAWPVKNVHLTDQQLNDIRTCVERPIEISFKGRRRLPFLEFSHYFDGLRQSELNNSRYRFHFGGDHYHQSPLKSSGWNQISPTPIEKQASEEYYTWMMNSTFCLTPRGDNLYSVRFSEVISAGCIPIVYGDDWVLPYNSEIVKDWNSLAVMIPQREVRSTLDIIRNISHEQRCTMQNNVLQFYNDYVKDSHGRLRAIVAMMDARLNHGLVNVTHMPR